MLLVHYSGSWADEIDLEGFRVFNDMDEFKKAFLDDVNERLDDKYYDESEENKKHYSTFDEALHSEEELSITCGTNEDIEYERISRYFRDFSFDEISDVEAEVIEKLFDSSYGFFPFF